MTLNEIGAFSVVAAALALVPGPTVTVIIANSLRHGTRAGLANVIGTQLGFVIWLGLATLGLGAAIQLMGTWFDLLRYAGAAYLVWLGVKMFLSKGDLALAADRPLPRGSYLLQGFVVIMSNPKMLVLFGTLIPPFLTPGGDSTRETLLLGLIFMAVAAAGDTAYALLAGKARRWLAHDRVRSIEIVSGVCLVGGGLWLALRGR